MELDFLHLDYKFENDFILLQIYKDASLICITWLRHTNSDELRAGFTMGLDEVKNWQLKNWLSDTRAINYAEAADQKWVIEVSGQLAADNGLVKIAHIVSEDAVRMLVAYNVADRIQELYPGFKSQVEIFSDKDEAILWLDI